MHGTGKSQGPGQNSSGDIGVRAWAGVGARTPARRVCLTTEPKPGRQLPHLWPPNQALPSKDPQRGPSLWNLLSSEGNMRRRLCHEVFLTLSVPPSQC